MPKFYPIYLNISDKKCVIVGGGDVAYRKACSLREAEAKVTVVSPEFCENFLNDGNFDLNKKEYEVSDINNASIVVASTNNEEVNKTVYADAVKMNIPVNVVDQPHLCSFIVPSMIRRGDLCVSISTGGTGPALARNIRESLEERFGPEYADFTALLSIMRKLAMSKITDDKKRKNVLQNLADDKYLTMIKQSGRDAAEKEMRKTIEECG